MRVLVLTMVLAGCQQDLASIDSIFYKGGERKVHCAIDLDSKGRIGFTSIDGGLDRALRDGEVIELYAHHPGVTVPIATIEHVLAGAQQRGLAFDTYTDLARGTWSAPGIALSFDDSSVDAWWQQRPLFQQYGARVTFFVTRYARLSDAQHAELQDLAADGHDIEAHTVSHQRAPQYVEDNGLDAYMADEAQPSIDVLNADGYDVTAFAYPYGARTSELDHALLGRVQILRSIAFSYEGVVDPCPL